MRSAFEFKAEWSGLENRLARMFDSDSGRSVMLAVDHDYFHGAPDGLKNLEAAVAPLLPHCDAISPCIGGLTCLDPRTRVPIILRATGGNSMAKTRKIPVLEGFLQEELMQMSQWELTCLVEDFKKKNNGEEIKYESVPEDLEDEMITVSIPTIIRANAIGFTASCYIGAKGEFQKQTIKNLTDLADEGHKYGLIAIGITAVGTGLKRDVKYIEHASRILVANGADIIKTYYCDGFEQVVNSCHRPIVIAGGKKLPTKEALSLTYNAIQAGACGVDMGRNIFKNQSPVAMIQAVREIVHKGATSDEAFELYRSLGGMEKE